uniref:DUF695 domain-containing protein n=1 Tax=Panagrolaimus davidi TaxID=227884 RepID=A0A914R001_9BILA
MSSLPDQIIAEKTWQYKITSDSNNPILLEFETPDEIIKTTPNLLMAFLIKEQIKAIERETNVRPRKIAFWVFDIYSEDEQRRIYTKLKESCKILSDANPKYQIECEFPFVKL